MPRFRQKRPYHNLFKKNASKKYAALDTINFLESIRVFISILSMFPFPKLNCLICEPIKRRSKILHTILAFDKQIHSRRQESLC